MKRWMVIQNIICSIWNFDYRLSSNCEEDKQEESSKIKMKTGKKLPYKITNEHICHAREFMNKNFKTKTSVGLLKNYLDGIEDLPTLSKSGLYHLLTKIIKFSYKKAHLIPK